MLAKTVLLIALISIGLADDDPASTPSTVTPDVTTPAGPPTFHPGNYEVPAVAYITTAVNSLEESYSLTDDPDQRANYWKSIMNSTYKASWNVVENYDVILIDSKIFVEVLVSDGNKWRIFN